MLSGDDLAAIDLFTFTLTCRWCDRDDAPGTQDAAEQLGWTDIDRDEPEGLSWTHVGVCPDCQRHED